VELLQCGIDQLSHLSTIAAVGRNYQLMKDSRPAHPSIAASIQGYAGAIAMVAVSTLIGLWIAPRWGTGPVDMIYLPAVLAAAVLWGLGPALLAGLTAALAYNFFFTEPIHTLRIDRVADVVTVVVLLIVALVTSKLAAGIREQARIAAAHAARNATIAGFAGRLLSSSGEAEVAEAAGGELHRLFDCNAILVTGLPHPKVLAVVPAGNRLTPSDVAAAVLTLESGEPAGRGTARVQPAEWVFHPVRSGARVIAAAGLARDDGLAPLAGEQLQPLGSLLDQLALALERERLAAETRRFEETRKRDRLRTALLASIGQEVRPRLEAIGAAARELRRSSTGEKEIVSTIGSEALKIDRYVANLVELGPEGDQRPVELGDISIDLFNRAVSRDGKPVHLTPKEYAVLAELTKHRGRLLTHAQLLRAVWGPAQEKQIDYLRVAIRALRQKLEAEPSRPRLIVNEPGVGYRLIAG
jgi:two-component system sensor histidine kinase KdpD